MSGTDLGAAVLAVAALAVLLRALLAPGDR